MCSQASQEREAQLASELAVLGAELARIRPVAARATAREIGSGSKDEGIIPMAMHLEEAILPAPMHAKCRQTAQTRMLRSRPVTLAADTFRTGV